MVTRCGYPDSWYAAQNASLLEETSFGNQPSAHHYDLCVIGAGLAGLTVAQIEARKGRRVCVLEANRVGFGASGRNGGFVSPGFAQSIGAIERQLGLDHARALFEQSRRGLTHVSSIIKAHGDPDLVAGRGWLKLLRHDDAGRFAQHAERMAKNYGAYYEVLDQTAITKHYLSTERYFSALLDPEPFHIDPLRYVLALAKTASDYGAEIVEGLRVADVAADGTAYRISVEGAEDIRSDRVLIATSAYGGPVNEVERAVLPVATYVVTSAPLSDDMTDAIRFSGCIGDTRRASDYYRLVGDQDGAKRLLWGGRITTQRHEPADLANKLREDIISVYPQLGRMEIEYAWSGLMGYARHKMPIVGELSPGLYVSTAFGGHGLNTSASAALAICEAMAGDRTALELYAPFGAAWGFGPIGRLATQIEYWRLRILDHLAESARRSS